MASSGFGFSWPASPGLYVFGLAGLQATAHMSEQVLVDKFGCTLDKVTTLYHEVLYVGKSMTEDR